MQLQVEAETCSQKKDKMIKKNQFAVSLKTENFLLKKQHQVKPTNASRRCNIKEYLHAEFVAAVAIELRTKAMELVSDNQTKKLKLP